MDSEEVSATVRQWAIDQGDDARLRIVLCGYEGEHNMPPTWRKVAWKARGGYGNQDGENANASRERLWLSPHCMTDAQGELFPALLITAP